MFALFQSICSLIHTKKKNNNNCTMHATQKLKIRICFNIRLLTELYCLRKLGAIWHKWVCLYINVCMLYVWASPKWTYIIPTTGHSQFLRRHCTLYNDDNNDYDNQSICRRRYCRAERFNSYIFFVSVWICESTVNNSSRKKYMIGQLLFVNGQRENNNNNSKQWMKKKFPGTKAATAILFFQKK